MTPARFYDAKSLLKIAELFVELEALYKKFEPSVNSADEPLYIFSTEIVVRHKDDYTVGKIGMDDFLYFEITDETYGEKPKAVKIDDRDFPGTEFGGTQP